jgi:protoporphyrinogen oxidase
MNDNTLILGAGMTGLAAGIASGLRVFEAADNAGGICQSYYMRAGETQTLVECPPDEEVYRFENGGGHWLFGGDPTVLHFIRNLLPVNTYERRSSVFFPDTGVYVPYPIQNHLRFLDSPTRLAALTEMTRPSGPVNTMDDWLRESFGATLYRLFFAPFHDLYTAGLYQTIAPQDGYKTPVDLGRALQGAFDEVPATGYNTTFVYPRGGLNLLARHMADQCRIEYGCKVVSIDTNSKIVSFADGSRLNYDRLLSTLPLNQMISMSGLTTRSRPDPYSSVLVVNIGATRGTRCPDDHWLYIPASQTGFHRVGFYSNVERSFLPASARSAGDKVSIYVEKAFAAGNKPTAGEIQTYCTELSAELREWGFIGQVDTLHPTWIEVAYTWTWPGSGWKREALQLLEQADIYQVGRYGRWIFQGIADSIRDGFVAGSSFR